MCVLGVGGREGIRTIKAHTHTPTFAGSVIESAFESADSSSESADLNTNPPVGI